MTAIMNVLIERLPKSQSTALLDACETIELIFGKTLSEEDEPIHHVYFPLKGYISLITHLKGQPPLEIGLVGNEGMLGATLALGMPNTPMIAIVQGSGSALRITKKLWMGLMESQTRLLPLVNCYLYVMIKQLKQTTACTRFHEIEPRLARWLLMTHDRAHCDEFHLTQEFLSVMLGVRRSGVTLAAGKLQDKKLIHYNRGKITVQNRAGLEESACECYAVNKKHYANAFKAFY